MADPTLAVDVEWVAGTWTDETSRVMGWDTGRGRRFELERFTTGRASVVFDNADRRYDPTHTTGPLYGNLQPNRRLRIRATWAGATHHVFVGYIDRITQEYAPPSHAVAIVDASDALKLLARAALPASVWDAEIADEFPTWWFPFDETEGSTVARSRTSWEMTATATGTVTFGADELVTRAAGSAVTFTDENAYLTVRSAETASVGDVGVTTAAPFTIEFLVKAGRTTPDHGALTGAGVIYFQEANDGTNIGTILIRFYGQSDGTSKVEFLIESRPAAGGASTIRLASTSGVNVADVNTHHIAVTYSAGAMRIYVDGVERTSAATTWTGPTVPRVKEFYVGSQPGAGNGIGFWDATLDELVIFGASVLSAAAVAEHYAAMKVGGQWAGDTTGGRVNRILDEIGYTDPRSVDTGRSTLIPATLGGDALSYLQRVDETEGGRLYVTADGTVRFAGRSSTWNAPLTATYSDDPAATVRYVDVAYDRDDALIKNDVTVSREAGAAYRVTDTASRDEHGLMSVSLAGLLHDNDAESLDRAQFVVNVYAEPQDRIQRLAVNPYAAADALFPRVLADDVGTRLRVRRHPQSVGAATEADWIVEEVRHRWSPQEWHTEYALSPAGAADMFQLDDTDGAGLGGMRLAY